MGVGGQRHAPAALHPGKRSGTRSIGGSVGPRAGLDECEKSRLPPGFDPRTTVILIKELDMDTFGKLRSEG